MQKKNRIFMALVSILLCFVLLSTSLLSGIFARFAVRDSVQMDVAFKQWGITITDANNTLVETIEKDGSAVVRANGSITQDGLLAPGTKGSLAWFRVSGNPEVDFSIDFSGTIDFGTGFGLTKNLDETDILVKIVYDNVVKAREEKIAEGKDYSKLNYPLSLIKEMVANALNNVAMTQDELSNLAKVHRNSATANDLDGELLKLIYKAIKDGQYNGDVVELKRELNKVFKLRDETGKEIEYLPIIIRCVAYDVITDGEQVTLNKIDSEVLGEDYYCLKRVDNLGKVHYFADSAAENISTLENFMNGDDEGSLNTALDTPLNRTGTEIDRIYSVEWEWFYHYATEAEIDAGSVTNNRDSTAVGDYQTAELDTQLGEMIAKYPEFFDINIDVNMLVEQVNLKNCYERFTDNNDIEKVRFGSYPQSEVTDDNLKATLDSKVDAYTTWKSHSGNTQDAFVYVDVKDGSDKYRGVKTSESATSISWFKFEPITWTILTEENGEATMISEMLLDMNYYQDTGNIEVIDENAYVKGTGAYANSWEYSSIRQWLNDTFYKTAFDGLQKEIVSKSEIKNDSATTRSNAVCVPDKNTEDKVFLLSYKECTSGVNTYYSKLIAMLPVTATEYASNIGTDSYYWTRSPASVVSQNIKQNSKNASALYHTAKGNGVFGMTQFEFDITNPQLGMNGVRPVVKIKL